MQVLLYSVIVFALSLGLMLLLMPRLLPKLRALKLGQTIYELGPKHQQKQGTPNMGGLLIGACTVVSLLCGTIWLCGSAGIPFFSLDNPMWGLLFISVFCMGIGFTDDYIKDVKKRHDGLSPKQKLLMQLVVGVVFSLYCRYLVGTEILLPFTDKTWNLGIFYVPVMTVLVMFMTNSANLQDGVDGILSSVTVVGMAAFGIIALLFANMASGGEPAAALTAVFGDRSWNAWYMPVAILCFALAGASVGFLFFNHHPAKIFMGDTGSMFIGGAFVGVAMLLKCQFLLIPICFTCIMSSVSVMMQTTYFKYTRKKTGTGKRIFKMAPIHHHFELSGMKENQIVLMYAAVTLVLCVLAVWSVAAVF